MVRRVCHKPPSVPSTPGMTDIVFSREGRLVVVADAGGLAIMSLRPDADAVRVATDRLRGVAAFADQIWIVDGPTPALRRIDERGRAIGAPRPVADDARAKLMPITL